MRCVRCGVDSRLKERSDGRCRSCKGLFAFEPRRGDPFTDRAFQRAIEFVSAMGRLRWGVENLYYELCRRRQSALSLGPLGCSVLALFLFAAAFAIGSLGGEREAVLVPGGLGLLAAIYAWARARAGHAIGLLPLETFNRLWQRWKEVHGTPPSVIVRQGAREARPRESEPDLHDYSFDRAVICDRARTVDLLLANDFHFENNCAVLAITGYPELAFETVRAMLRRNPRLEVFALHDATPFGCRIAHRLETDPAWFAGGAGVRDVGLRPAQCRPWRPLWVAAEVSDVQPGGGLGPEEARWLSRYRLELAALRPERVLKRLFQTIVGGDETTGGDSFG